MIKPDGVQRGFIGRIISRFEDKGFQLVGLKMLLAEESVLDEHYAELKVPTILLGLALTLRFAGPTILPRAVGLHQVRPRGGDGLGGEQCGGHG